MAVKYVQILHTVIDPISVLVNRQTYIAMGQLAMVGSVQLFCLCISLCCVQQSHFMNHAVSKMDKPRVTDVLRCCWNDPVVN